MRFDPRKLADQLEAAVKTLRQYGPDAARLAQDWATPLRAAGERPGKGGISDPTSTVALAEPDPTADFAATLNREATVVSSHLALLLSPVVELGRAAKSSIPPPERKPASGAGHCEACAVWVDGTATNRLRAGYCNACRVAWSRWIAAGNPPDRSRFRVLRRKPEPPVEVEQVDTDRGHRAHQALPAQTA